jgi:hypothetical protein
MHDHYHFHIRHGIEKASAMEEILLVQHNWNQEQASGPSSKHDQVQIKGTIVQKRDIRPSFGQPRNAHSRKPAIRNIINA